VPSVGALHIRSDLSLSDLSLGWAGKMSTILRLPGADLLNGDCPTRSPFGRPRSSRQSSRGSESGYDCEIMILISLSSYFFPNLRDNQRTFPTQTPTQKTMMERMAERTRRYEHEE
jgi:hypothetical protein